MHLYRVKDDMANLIIAASNGKAAKRIFKRNIIERGEERITVTNMSKEDAEAIQIKNGPDVWDKFKKTKKPTIVCIDTGTNMFAMKEAYGGLIG